MTFLSIILAHLKLFKLLSLFNLINTFIDSIVIDNKICFQQF